METREWKKGKFMTTRNDQISHFVNNAEKVLSLLFVINQGPFINV